MGHVFISYSHRDSEYAHALADRLQGIGFSVWIDDRLDYGSQWPFEIQKQLDSCGAFILIMSPRSYASEWVQNELQRAKRKAKPVFPLLLEGDEPWLSVETTQFYDVRDRKLPDDEFYTDLKNVVSARQNEQLASTLQVTSTKTTTIKSNRPWIRTSVFVMIFAAMSFCLFLGVLFFQQATNGRFLVPISGGLKVPSSSPKTAVSQTVTETSTVLPVQLPDGSKVTMFGGGSTFQYTVLSAQREPLSPEKQLLRLRIRAWTDNVGGLNFWNDSFRLVAGDLSLTPVNFLNEVVARNETVDGDVEFEIDASLPEATLVIILPLNFSGNTKELRLIFPSPSAGTVISSLPAETTTALPPVQLPDGSEVTMISSWGSKFQYTVLSAQRETVSPGKQLLSLHIRVWTDNVGGMNFWNDSFRLVAGELSLAPVNFLDEVVNANKTMDGDVEFEIDASLKEATLVIKVSLNFPENTKELRLVFP
jgi:hypothetical protein